MAESDSQKEFEFALKFMGDHPESAVRVLEKSKLEAVSALFSSSPANYCSPVFRCMLPEFAARICETLDSDIAASIISTLDANTVSAILRLLPVNIHEAILHEIPAKLREKTTLLLDYPTDTVGAWMSPHVLVAANDMKNKHLLRMLRKSSSQDDSEYIFVTDRNGIYLGRTRFLDILKAGEDLPVTSFMDRNCPSLPASLLIAQAQSHSAWEYSDALPVTDGENRLLGLLHHHMLRQALEEKQIQRGHHARGEDAAGDIFDAYGQSLLALLNTVSETIEQ